MDWNWKMILKSLLGGAIIIVVANFVLPYLNKFLTFVPQDLFRNWLGLTPHNVIAFTLAVYAAKWVEEKAKFLN